MKKIIIGILSILTLTTSAGVFSAVAPVAHAAEKACPTCGKSEHYNYQYTKQEATCTEAGIEDWFCSDTACASHHDETTPALGHSYTKEEIKGRGENVADGNIYDCTSQVVAYHLCSRCDDIGTSTFIYREAGSNHVWGDWETMSYATCTTEGSEMRRCTNENCAECETRTIPARHTWGNREIIAAPSCLQPAEYKYTCEICKLEKTQKKEPLGHAWSAWNTTTAATCTTQGSKTHTCTRCNETETWSIQSLGHDYTKQAIKGRGENVVSGNIYDCTSRVVAYHLCSRCDAIGTTTFVYREAGSHTWGEWETTTAATCTTDGEKTRNCTNCAESETETITHPGHAWSAWQTNTAVTCETDGSKTRTCSVCSKSETQTITHPGHIYGDKVNVLASCTLGAGWRQTCSVCGDVHVYNGDSDPLGHVWSDWQITGAATCTALGAKVRECSRCNQHETQTIPALGHDFTKQGIKGRGENVADGNVYDCTTELVCYYLCSRCDAIGTETYVHRAAGAHEWGEWETTTAATCGKDGVKTRTCTVCAESETQTIPAAGAHTWGNWTTTTAATCTVNGVKVRTCTMCKSNETQSIPTIPHDYSKRGDTLSDIVSGDIHNCATPVIMAYRCSKCDASGVNTSYTYVYREAGAHEAEKYYHAATCTEPGSSGEQCANCGKDLKSETLPALGHDFNEERVCSRCGTDADYIIKFFDHDFTKIDETTSAKGETIDFPSPNPERRGYSFAGWYYYDEAGEYVKVDKFQTVHADMEIYAYYTPVYINVHITDSVTGKTTVYKILDNYTLAESLKTVEHNGYKFLGYTRDGANVSFATDTPITEEYFLTANYEITLWGQIFDFVKSLSGWAIVIIIIAIVVLVLILRNNGGNGRRHRR